MAGPGQKCTAARLAVAWTVPAGSGPGPANAGVATTRSVPDSAVTAARSPAPATSDRERRCRRRLRTSAQPTPTGSPARAACLKHACLTAMAAWLPAFSGYGRGRSPAASTLRRGPGRVQVGRAQHRPTKRRAARAILLVPASLLLLIRPALERGPPPLNPFAACSTAYHACQVAPCTGCNGPSCNMQPGMMRRAIRRQRKLQHTRARADTEEHTHAHTRANTRVHTRACTHSHVQTHTHTLMCAHGHTHTHVCARTHRHTETDPHAHARGPSLGAVARRDEPQPSAQMRAEAGANKCTRGCAEVLAQMWAGVSRSPSENVGGSEQKSWRRCRQG